MADLEKTINDLEEIEANMTFYKHPESAKVVRDAIKLLKEQQAIIDQYHQADTFLAVHGWQWKRTTTDSGTSQKAGDGE